MNTKLSKTMIMILLAVSTATISAAGVDESITYLPPPQKQMVNGTAAEDVICNSGLTLMLKSSSGSPACVQPQTAMKLEENGWGTVFKESSMMEEDHEKMIAEIMMANESIYDPKITPSDFISEINNKFFALTPGTTLVYESQTHEGVERIEVTVTYEKRNVMGVDTIVVWDRVWLNDELIEDTKDWFAQDLEGNVWYFGEDSKEFEGGQLVGTKGSWEAGIDNAKPGIIMKASPQVGDSYRQEYYSGEAEDMGEVVALGETVSVPYGTFSDCIKTKDWNVLEPGVIEFKYYCPGIGGVVLETNPDYDEIVELIDVRTSFVTEEPAEKPIEEPTKVEEATEKVKELTMDEAMEIALKAVPGIVTEKQKSTYGFKTVYEFEIMAENGIETDVFIDIETGNILAIET